MTFRTILAAAIIILSTSESLADERAGARARSAYEAGEFDRALQEFREGKEKSGGDFRFSMGEGSALYRLQNYEGALASFSAAASTAKTDREKAQALYDAGNSLVQLSKFKEAIEIYERSLKFDPKDKETKENLEYAKRLLREQQKDQNKDNKQNK